MLNDLVYLVVVSPSDSSSVYEIYEKDVDAYEVEFGVTSRDKKFMDDNNKPINTVFDFSTTIGGVDATNVVETVIEIITDHYENIATGPSAYIAHPIQDHSNGKWTNKRLSLYQRQAKRAAKNRDIDDVSIKTGNMLGDQNEEHDEVVFIFK